MQDKQILKIEGQWVKTKPADWKGKATCITPIVAVSFLIYEGMFSWCKSERANIEGQEVRLLLGWYDKEGIDVQVNFGATCSVLWRTILPDTTYLPRFIEEDEYNTEEIFKFMVIEGNPKVECWLLFLQGKYVKVGRNGLWHLRGEYKTLFNEKISSILSYGKAGKQAFDKTIFT